jgi:peptidoglycan/LPS O-acetylase OafA/YrhL
MPDLMTASYPREPAVAVVGTRLGAVRGERVGALDGLRAVAVVAVVIYHLSPRLLPSGYLGVDVFMVVSGFLITGLLVREYEHSGGIRLAVFWGRRFRRLVPALVLLLVVVAAWVGFVGPRSLTPSIRTQGLAALFYVSNWKLIASGVTSGGSVGASSPLVHLWSLAVEEQFYLLWPPLLLVLLRIAR